MHIMTKMCVCFSVILLLSLRYLSVERNKNKIRERINELENKTNPNLPKNFMFGVSSSSYQTEGGNLNSNYSEWETKNGLEKSGKACNSWERFDEDLKSLIFIKADSYRFSIEWSRLEPSMGNFQIDIIKEYKKRILLLKKNNIEPIITLVHFSLPLWISKMGGYLNSDFTKYYSNYVQNVFNYLQTEVKYWITFNEVMLDLVHSFILGRRPPQQKMKYKKFIRALQIISKSHILAYKIIIKKKNSEIGIAENFLIIKPKRIWNPLDHILGYIIHYYTNRILLNNIVNYLTFIGLNHYNVAFVSCSPFGLDLDLIGNSKIVTDMEWGFNSSSLFEAINYIYNKYKIKIIVTEHGVAENKQNDKIRVLCLRSSIACIESAISKNIPVIGYNYWSLMDNVEWEFGKKKRFGLFFTDYLKAEKKEDRLTKKKSAYYFRNIQKKRKRE